MSVLLPAATPTAKSSREAARTRAFFSFVPSVGEEQPRSLYQPHEATQLLPPPAEVADNSLKALGSSSIFDDQRETYMEPIEKPTFLKPADAAVSSVMTSDSPFESGRLHSANYSGREGEDARGAIGQAFGFRTNQRW
ncbi:hypothetical protein QKT49_gp384 [Acanthamoeba castellanii medusavirus]|uniref:Uncharacterized protein n=1 Tax=Acanthamoeba castellanii medusavirus J1 TaxID=3114988 RepID=A0A3T1CX43_9VIRU|nr:hypothetical protein QKT49_gp384 [Acanthamoeba castellanii medusavirus]BBI30379.1 hypothetical protein [Acanthamoeba castellanii medusavirus J1]